MKGRLAKATFALAAALVFVVTPARGTVSVSEDGAWWQGLTATEKVVALEGMLAGVDSGYISGHTDGYFYALLTFGVPPSKWEGNAAALSDERLAKKPKFSKAFGTYIDEINVWYEVHPKRTSIDPSDLLESCFADKPILPSCDDLGSDLDK